VVTQFWNLCRFPGIHGFPFPKKSSPTAFL
jgi:hypothetical protein